MLALGANFRHLSVTFTPLICSILFKSHLTTLVHIVATAQACFPAVGRPLSLLQVQARAIVLLILPWLRNLNSHAEDVETLLIRLFPSLSPSPSPAVVEQTIKHQEAKSTATPSKQGEKSQPTCVNPEPRTSNPDYNSWSVEVTKGALGLLAAVKTLGIIVGTWVGQWLAPFLVAVPLMRGCIEVSVPAERIIHRRFHFGTFVVTSVETCRFNSFRLSRYEHQTAHQKHRWRLESHSSYNSAGLLDKLLLNVKY